MAISSLTALRQEGYRLLHEGSIALAQVESNGLKINEECLEKTQTNLESLSAGLRKEVMDSDLWKRWVRRYGVSANITSGPQLASVLYTDLGLPIPSYTDKGQPSVDEEALSTISHPTLPKLVRFLKYEKARGTFLKGIQTEIGCDGRLHPFFHLDSARTYRSSSSAPNFQNQPVRDKEISKIIRTNFTPSPGCVLCENDFKGIEVALSASYHRDPNFISYITTPGKDMHRDMAAQIFCVDPKDVSKDARYGAKNKFVFPQFYGDWFYTCAKSLWDWAIKGKLKVGEVPMLEYLKSQGIHELGNWDPNDKENDPEPGTFIEHLQAIEDDFWNNRFQVYGKWRREWYQAYLDNGYFDILTGFRVHGIFGRNACTNYPIQGSAFHCLLWSLTEIQRTIKQRGMATKIVGQIHDSLIADVPYGEVCEYLTLVERVTTKGLPLKYPWLVVSPEIEYEIAPNNWFEKREMKFKDGRFLHPTDNQKSTTNFRLFLETLTTQTK